MKGKSDVIKLGKNILVSKTSCGYLSVFRYIMKTSESRAV